MRNFLLIVPATYRQRCVVGTAVLALFGLVAGGCHDDAKLPEPPAELKAIAAPPRTTDERKSRVDRAIAITGSRVLNGDPAVGQDTDAVNNKAWQVVHGILAYGYDLKMSINGETVSALKYLFDGKPLNGWQIYKAGKGLEAVEAPGSSISQGHPDQWIGYLSQCGVKLDDTIMVEVKGKLEPHKFHELIDQAKWTIRDGKEASWTLMALAAYPEYVPLFGAWKNSLDEVWTIERIVKMEANAGYGGDTACGGSHRLYALAEALKRFEESPEFKESKIGYTEGSGWLRARDVLDQAMEDAFNFQQPDGGFSNGMFERSGMTADADARINSTGHVLEVLAYHLPQSMLESREFERAVDFFCRKIEETKSLPVGCGGLYHGANGLKIYRDRRWPTPAAVVAQQM